MAIALLSQSHSPCKGYILLKFSIPCVFSTKFPVLRVFIPKDGDSWSYPVCVHPYRASFISLPLIPYTIVKLCDKLPSSLNLQAHKAFSFRDVLGLRFPNPRNASLQSFPYKNFIKQTLHTTLYVNITFLIKWLVHDMGAIIVRTVLRSQPRNIWVATKNPRMSFVIMRLHPDPWKGTNNLLLWWYIFIVWTRYDTILLAFPDLLQTELKKKTRKFFRFFSMVQWYHRPSHQTSTTKFEAITAIKSHFSPFRQSLRTDSH